METVLKHLHQKAFAERSDKHGIFIYSVHKSQTKIEMYYHCDYLFIQNLNQNTTSRAGHSPFHCHWVELQFFYSWSVSEERQWPLQTCPVCGSSWNLLENTETNETNTVSFIKWIFHLRRWSIINGDRVTDHDWKTTDNRRQHGTETLSGQVIGLKAEQKLYVYIYIYKIKKNLFFFGIVKPPFVKNKNKNIFKQIFQNNSSAACSRSYPCVSWGCRASVCSGPGSPGPCL